MTTTSAAKLLPCPFCAKPPITERDGSVKCESCYFWMDAKTWNRRALPDDRWVSVKREPDIETLQRMAEELRLIPKGQILNSDWFTILQRQYRAAIAASPKPPEPRG